MSLQGRIIEYVDHGKFICAYVQEDSGKRLRLLNQNSREVNLPQARVVHEDSRPTAGGAKDGVLAVLKQVAATRQALTGEVALEEIWELASAEGQEEFAPRFLAELCFGGATGDDQVAAFLRCVFEDKLFFKYRSGKILVNPSEVVEQQRERLAREKAQEALLENSARGLTQLMQGEEPVDWPERQRCLAILRDYYLHDNEAAESALARELLKNAGLTRPHDIFYLLVRAGVWQADENIPLLRHEVPVRFSEAALAQAIEVGDPTAAELLAEKRRDLRELDLFTIDGPLTRDYDDALHLERRGENFLVGIHISDVARYVPPGTPLFEAALARGTTLYFPDSVVPMLPTEISEGVCSLVAGQDRAALSFLVTLSPAAEVLDYEIVPSVVRVKRQLTYPGVDAVADTDQEIKTLVELTGKLQARRVEAGALILAVPDVDITVGAAGVEVNLNPVDTPARSLVAELMVLANSLGAQYVGDREAGGLFRSQAPPKKNILHGSESEFFPTYRQRKYLSPGKLLTKPQPHSGVGVMQYTTLTSPIRRLLDLIMQHQLISLIRGRGECFERRRLEEFVDAIQRLQTRSRLVAQQRRRYWLLRYLENRVGERLEALVLERGPKRIKMVLTDILMDCDLPVNSAIAARPGDTVRLMLAKVNPLDDLLRLEW